MTCDWVCQMIDDYLENRLGQHDRQRLEMHLTLCRSCAEEVRTRPAFERAMWRWMATSVQGMRLPAEASRRIVEAAQASMRHAVWSRRALMALQAMAGAVVVLIALAGLLTLTDRIQLLGVSPPALLSPASPTALSLAPDAVFIEPWNLRPGELFTMTLLLRSDAPQPLDTARIDLDISGPTGNYHFTLAVRGPLPVHGLSVLRVTPDLLEAPCRSRYQKSPAEILSVPGVYTFRVTLFSPVLVGQR